MTGDAWTKADPTACPICGKDSCEDHLPPQAPAGRLRRTLAYVYQTFRAWFGPNYDLDVINAILATAAAERLDGDPLWLLLISGSGATKTESVCSLRHTSAFITSTITSDGALLSGSPTREKAKDATGGLLKRIGSSGVLVIKDVTSILSMDRNTRATVLAALREVHDGYWERNVGSDGGRTLKWAGRIAVIGACTTAWDRAHDVVAAMGDRFVILRMDSSTKRKGPGYKAIVNTGQESRMREELADAVAGVLEQLLIQAATRPTPKETKRLLAAADLVTLGRTGVDYDYRGNVIDAHAPEMPTRLAKQLVQVLRGACAIGMPRPEALRLALRCARDSMPPLRLAILEDVAVNPRGRTRDIRQRLNKPYNTVDRQLQAFHMLGVLECDEVEMGEDRNGRPKSTWFYSVAKGIDPKAISIPDLLPPTDCKSKGIATHKSGTEKKPGNTA